MRKNVISRRSIMTEATIKMVNLVDYSMHDEPVALDGYLDDNSILAIINQNLTQDKAIAVLEKTYSAVTYYLEPEEWFKYAHRGEVEILTDEEAAAFGKRNRNKE